ncbi:MAG: OmpA family protein [Cyclobacteriaceae bacterium]|nr:OmpA family protein [Cyclobacteriaceae bacterium]
MKIKVIFYSLILLALTSCSASKKAEKIFKKGEFQNAIDKYEAILEKEPNNANANFFIAESFRQSNRIYKAAPYYEKAIKYGVKNDSVGLFYAYALKSSGKYASANNQLENYIASINDEYYLKRANDEIQNISYLDKLREKQNYYRVKNLENVNTSGAEYSPVYEDGYLYFTSSRSDKSKVYKATGTPFSNIYRVPTAGAKVDIEKIEILGEAINNYDINEGSVTFSPDGKTMVFARGNNGKKKGAADVNLFMTRLRNGVWIAPRMLSINKVNYWDSSPAFSSNGKTLYFASNRKGGFGGTDIYSAKMNSRGRFSKVKNLGASINTSGNEMFPYISDDGHMYFASDGHPGFGGLDLFYAKRSNGKTVVENLGEPLNSNADDFGLYLFKADRGFFTSNREEGKGDDDIYTFVNDDPNLKVVNYYLRGITMTHDDNDSLKILPKTKVQLLDINNEILDETITSNNGEFLFRVYEHEHYVLIGEYVGKTERYLKTREDFTTFGKSVPQENLTKLVTNITLDTMLVLEKKEVNKIIVLENIYYDLDKWDIRDDAALELDKLVVMLSDNPEIKIELSAHTDSRAPDNYNLELSQRRAKSAVNYIVSQGIESSRLTAKGYGETKLIIENAETEEEHQVNRRTEFKILEVGDIFKSTGDSSFDEDQFFDIEDDNNDSKND